MLFSIIITAILLGFIRGGKINNLLALKLKGFLLILSSLLIEAGMLYLMRSDSGLSSFLAANISISHTLVIIGVVLQYTLLFLFLLFNRSIMYSWLMGLGSLLNFIVIILNGGSMPLSDKILDVGAGSQTLKHLLDGRYLTYALISENTKLWLLGDIIYLPPPIKGFISIGDILLFAGIFLLIQSTMVHGEYNTQVSAAN